MRYAVISDGVVVNVVEAEPDWAADRGLVATEEAGPGWTYDGVAFAPPVVSDRQRWAQQAADRKQRAAKAALAEPDSDDPTVLRRKLNAAIYLLTGR